MSYNQKCRAGLMINFAHNGKNTLCGSCIQVAENFARHLAHRLQHARIGHTTPSHLCEDHALALNRAIPDLNRQFSHLSNVQTPRAVAANSNYKKGFQNPFDLHQS